jgi:hypothetical protein
VRLAHAAFKNAIAWSADPAVPRLREKEPHRFSARKGTWELLKHGGTRVLQCIAQAAIPVRKALGTRDPSVLPTALRPSKAPEGRRLRG